MSLWAMAAVNGGMGLINALRSNQINKANYRAQQNAYNGYMGELDQLGLNDPLPEIALDYGGAMSRARQMNQGNTDLVTRQIQQQRGAMNSQSRALGLQPNSADIGQMVGRANNMLGGQQMETFERLAAQNLQEQQMKNYWLDQSRKDQVNQLQAKYFGAPSKPASGDGWVGGLNALVGGYNSYQGAKSTQDLTNALLKGQGLPEMNTQDRFGDAVKGGFNSLIGGIGGFFGGRKGQQGFQPPAVSSSPGMNYQPSNDFSSFIRPPVARGLTPYNPMPQSGPGMHPLPYFNSYRYFGG